MGSIENFKLLFDQRKMNPNVNCACKAITLGKLLIIGQKLRLYAILSDISDTVVALGHYLLAECTVVDLESVISYRATSPLCILQVCCGQWFCKAVVLQPTHKA